MDIVVKITGFTPDEEVKMGAIRTAIQTAFKERFRLAKLEYTTVDFIIDPSLKPSLRNRIVSHLESKRFESMEFETLRRLCQIVCLLTESHGGHEYNEALPPGYTSMCDKYNPDFFDE